VVERALSNGDRVAATLRTPSDLSDLSSTYPATQLLVLPLDVTAPASSISDTFVAAVKAFGRIDIVVSNAGNGGISGEAEIIPVDNAKKTMDINFWGATKVALEALKVFRDVNSPKGGLFLHVSSSNGIDGLPLTAYYAAS
jgi:NAD(P)-dependent dehydrogenase (short-subunit alcohol dehydrogenase family)